MLDELLLAFFVASIYHADDAGKLRTGPEIHCALHAIAMYRATLAGVRA